MASKRRIGVHVGTAGGSWTAVDRAVAAGADTFQIFTASPRMWKAAPVKAEDAARMRAARAAQDVSPGVVHASYLINVCSQTESVRQNSVGAFRGEVERAMALGMEYLVLHPGSWKGLTRDEGLRLAAESITRAVDGIDFAGKDFHILIENTAGAEFSLGGKLEQVAELVECLKPSAPVAVCLDTCHLHVSGYDIVTEDGYAETMMLVRDTVGLDAVRVWHCNDAKAPLGSKLDRHEHIGEGTIGAEAFRRLLHDARFAHAAFIAETPVDAPGDEARNVGVLRTLAAG
ncbi:MAG: deoxyribonuclease IV [Acidobacteriota bacterium]|nr:deoxyribonuclease IV [Acidobacteriota bacterium]